MALAAGLRTTWVCLGSRLLTEESDGWFNYARLSEEPGGPTGYLVDDSPSDLVPALVAIAFIVVWAGASIWLFGLSHGEAGDEGSHLPDSN